MSKKRFVDIDFFKGIAILCMITFHYFYYPTQMGIPGYNYNTPILRLIAKIAQVIFIVCSGMNLSISYENNKEDMDIYYKKQKERIIKLYCYAFILSIVSYFLFYEKWIKFGILHFMAKMALLFYGLVHSDTILLIIGIIILLLTTLKYYTPSLFYKIPSPIAFIAGFYNSKYSSFDHFSIIPWSILYILGIFLGKLLYKHPHQFLPKSIEKATKTSIIKIGKYSLEIYMIHWIVLYLIF